jgi:hypothetical protein
VSGNKKQQAIPQKPMQWTLQQTISSTQSLVDNPETTEKAQKSPEKSLFETEEGNVENETKSLSSMKSQDRYRRSYLILSLTLVTNVN